MRINVYKKCDPACLTKLIKFVPFKKKKWNQELCCLCLRLLSPFQHFSFLHFLDNTGQNLKQRYQRDPLKVPSDCTHPELKPQPSRPRNQASWLLRKHSLILMLSTWPRQEAVAHSQQNAVSAWVRMQGLQWNPAVAVSCLKLHLET